jgi:hypothetical protein
MLKNHEDSPSKAVKEAEERHALNKKLEEEFAEILNVETYGKDDI